MPPSLRPLRPVSRLARVCGRTGWASAARHRYDRVLTATMTVICLPIALLYPGDGYDAVLAEASGLPGLRLRPGTAVPAGSAFSQAWKLLGELAVKRIADSWG